MNTKRAARLLLAFVFAGIAAGCAYMFYAQPYEVVSYTKVMYEVKPDGSGLAFLTLVALIASIITAFSGDWK